jgi:hypothetical protein
LLQAVFFLTGNHDQLPDSRALKREHSALKQSDTDDGRERVHSLSLRCSKQINRRH